MSQIPRLRTSLLLLVVAALLLTGTPAFAGTACTGDSALLAQITAPAAGTPEGLELVIPPGDDFILCTCKFCNANPGIECQISPSGYTILCADYSRLHNC
jgi:hypothetical protein